MAVTSPTAPAPRSRSIYQQVVADAWQRWGVRVGVAWIGLLLLLAVFSPFIASSHPLLMKVEGAWESPLVRHLGKVDVLLLVAFCVAVPLICLRRLAARTRWLVWGCAVTLTVVLTITMMDPPSVVVHERYRQLEREGKVEFILRAPLAFSPNDRVRDREEIVMAGPAWAKAEYAPFGHPLGQTPNNEDVASRMIHAARIALSVGFIATTIEILIGVFVGGLMGYFAGKVDLIGMRVVEIFEFIPTLYLLLMFVAFFPGDYPEVLPGIRVQRIYMIMLIIGLTGWAGYARYVRAEFLKLRRQDFVQAAIACGLPLRSILFRHMLPNGITPVLVTASFGVASAVLAEATLSFLGLGLIEEPSWGQLLNQAVRSGTFVWWIAIFPGLAIFITVLSYNMIGEALRDAIDPHTQRLQRAGT